MAVNDLQGPDVRLIERTPLRGDSQALAQILPALSPETWAFHIDYVWSPTARLQQWSDHAEEGPAEIGIVHTGYAVPDAGAIGDVSDSLGFSTTFSYVSEPGDLVQIGLELVKFFKRVPQNAPAVVSVDSISLMLQYASVDDVCRFVDRSQDIIAARDAVARYYFTPEAHDSETVERIRSRFS
ncbi:DUF7504 family protein [Halobellus rubicundus]|uniref:Uncharacterized protein n=1 Tax=Halobellus rubicundus TaxID=2996466 RepID=A0ABD5MKG7_9EURY